MEPHPSSNGGCGGGSCGCQGSPNDGQGDSTRRNLLKAAGVTLGAAAFAKALAPLATWSRDNLSVEDFLQQHYRELDKEQLAKVLKHLRDHIQTRIATNTPMDDGTPSQQALDAVNLAAVLFDNWRAPQELGPTLGVFAADGLTNTSGSFIHRWLHH